MGIYDRPYYRDDDGPSFFGSHRTMIVNLIIVNVVIFLVDVLFFGGSSGFALSWNVLAARETAVGPDTLNRPWMWWQFLTYGFAHDPRNAFHLIGNMLGLFFLGNEIEQLYGRGKFLQMYLTAIVGCGIAWSLTGFFLGQANPDYRSALVGASGAVTAVVILFALNFPRRMVLLMMFIPIPAWVLGVFIVLTNLWGYRHSGPEAESRTAYDVHLFGAAYAYLFFQTQWTFAKLLPAWEGLRDKLPFGKPRLRIHREPTERSTSLDAQADEILAKLHREGESSLTAKERKILEEYSRRMQQKYR